MNSCSFTISLLSAVIFLPFLSSTVAATCHPDDEAGLLSFKAGITQDPLGILSGWKKGTECCSWMGVICINNDRVTELKISGSTVLGRGILQGTISPLLAKLQHLEAISLTYLEKITGSFPQFLFQLPKLKHVKIWNTSLSGHLPVNIGALSNLEDVTMENNHFTGRIPSSISNLTRLTWLSLGGNRLSGTIPDIFKSLSELIFLRLSRNRFFGKVPPSLASLAPTLVILDLSHNHLSGTIPDYLSSFEALSGLDLSWNHYSGVVPMGFTNLTKLTDLHLSHNRLTGLFPAMYIGYGINSLDLSYNKFHLKTIPEWVTSSPALFLLNLVKCGIKMSLDDWKPVRTRSVYYIDLSENDISGSPEWFLNRMRSLQAFYASGNKLRFNLGKLNFTNSLRILDLSRNLVFGKVPASIAGLEQLSLSQNHLCGELPGTKFPASVFAETDCLCGSPLSPCDA